MEEKKIFGINYNDPKFILMGVEQMALIKISDSVFLSRLTERFSIYRDYNTYVSFIGDFLGRQQFELSQVIGELIRFDVKLGGNGLGYGNGVTFSYCNEDGVVTTGNTVLNDVVLNEYIQNGDEPFASGFEGHYINNPEDFPNQANDVDNFVLVDKTTSDNITDTSIELEQTDNSAKIAKSFVWGNFKLILIGMIQSVICGFIFGFGVQFVYQIINARKEGYVLSKSLCKEFAHDSIKYGIISMCFAFLFSITNYLLTMLISFIFGVYISPFMIQIILMMIYCSAIFIVLLILKIKQLKDKKTWYLIAVSVIIPLIICSPSLIFTGVLSFLSVIVCFANAIIIRLYLRRIIVFLTRYS